MIRFDEVTKVYRGTAKPALNSVSLEVLSGEFVFMVGASGSGKSSMLRLVLKEDRPTSGSIHVLGQDLNRISSRKVPYFRRNLGVVFQDFRLLPNKTVFDNVAFTLQVIGKSKGFIHEAVPDVLAMVGLDGKGERFPHELSGGEQQRLALARAWALRPRVLFLDEPVVHLDPAATRMVEELILKIDDSGTRIVMVSHDLGQVRRLADEVIFLHNGQLIEISPVTQFLGDARTAQARAFIKGELLG